MKTSILKDARGVLVNITGKEPTLNDYEEVSNIVEEFTAEDAYVIYGTVIDKDIDDDLLVTIVATGVNQKAPTLAVDNKRSASIKLNPVGLGKEAQVNNTSQEVGTSSAEALDFLDVPTFMRKQVD